MRFCPFCSAENAVDAVACTACARTLLPLPKRATSSMVSVSPVHPGPPVPTLPPIPAQPQAPAAPPLASPVMPEPPPRPSGRVPLPAPLPRQISRDTAPDRSLDRAFGQTAIGGEAEAKPAIPAQGTPAAPSKQAAALADTSLSPKTLAKQADDERGTTNWRLRRATFPNRVFTPPDLPPMPKCPDFGLWAVAHYTIAVGHGRYLRRKAIAQLNQGVVQETTALDLVLGDLGRASRAAGNEHKALDEENSAITRAEQARELHGQKSVELTSRRNDEVSRASEVDHERLTGVSDAERRLAAAEREYERLESERRKLRESIKEVTRRAAAYEKSGLKREREAEKLGASDAAVELRRAADHHRREAALLQGQRQEADRKLALLEAPLGVAREAVRTGRADLEIAKASLRDAREGHRQRLTEYDAEQARNTAAFSQADGEIQRRLVTLGTLVNLHRLPGPDTAELFARIDRLKAMIAAHAQEIELLASQRDGFDRPSFYRGIIVWSAAVVVLFTIVAIILVLV